MMELGVIPVIVEMLNAAAPHDPNSQYTTGILWHIAKSSEPGNTALLDADAVDPLVKMLGEGQQAPATVHACGALQAFSSTKRGRVQVRKSNGLPKLIALIKNGTHGAHSEGCRAAATALHGLAVDMNNQQVKFRRTLTDPLSRPTPPVAPSRACCP